MSNTLCDCNAQSNELSGPEKLELAIQVAGVAAQLITGVNASRIAEHLIAIPDLNGNEGNSVYFPRSKAPAWECIQ